MHAEEVYPSRASLRRQGFTLIEVVLALAISAMVVLSARLLVENLGSANERLLQAARNGDQDANGERLLRSLVGQIEVGVQNETFGGDERSAHFTSWCQSPRGWLERCRISLVIDTADSVPALIANLPDGERVILRTGPRLLRFRYLVDAGAGGIWLAKWGDGLLAPRAIGVVADSDTIIVRIGERG